MVVANLTFIEEAVSQLKTWRWDDFKRQMEGQELISPMPKSKRNLSRRPNACLPCQRSKVKCDGLTPSCTACTKKRPKSQSLCVYPAPLLRRRAATSQTEAELDQESVDSRSDLSYDVDNNQQELHGGPPCVIEEDLFGVPSIAQSIDQFKQLAGSPNSPTYPRSVSDCTGMEAFEFTDSASIIVDSVRDKSDDTQMAPLCSYSLPHTLVKSMPSYLKSLHDYVVRLQGMIRLGNLMDAWTRMPRLVRMAEISRLDCNQVTSTPLHDPWESEYRRRVWWSILELDIHICMHNGRRLAAQVKLGIERPTLSGVEGAYKDLEQSKLDFTQYALEVLDGLSTYTAGVGDCTYESLIDLTKLDRLQRMEERLAQIPKELDNDEQLTIAIEDHKLEFHSLKMMLSCAIASAAKKERGTFSIFQKDSTRDQRKSISVKAGRHRAVHQDEAYPHQAAILDSARAIIGSFSRVETIDICDQYANWTRLFNAFCATAILSVAYLREESRSMSDVHVIKTMSDHFQDISNRNPNGHIATVAAKRISELLGDIEEAVAASTTEQRSKVRQTAPSVSKLKSVASEGDASTAKPQGVSFAKKRKVGNTEPSLISTMKRRKRDVTPPKQESPPPQAAGNDMMYAQSSQYDGIEARSQGYNVSGQSVFANDPESAATSFNTSTGVAQCPPYGTYDDQMAMNNANGISWYWHPPMAQPHPPLRDLAEWTVPAYTTGDAWPYPTMAQYHSNMIPEQFAQVGGTHEPGPLYNRGSMSISVPHTPVQQQLPSSNQYYTDTQPFLSQIQMAAGTVQSGNIAQSASQEEETPWEWVQHQQSLTRRNSSLAAQTTGATNEALYCSQPEYFQSYDIPPTTRAWG